MDTNRSKSEQFFTTDHLNNDLKGHSVRSGVITVASQITKFAFQTSSTLILARLLSPEDFGLIGMVAVVLNFIDPFKDLGLSSATIQKPEINHAQVSTLFWINIALSGVITLLTISLAPLVASFYQEPRVVPIMVVLAFALFLGGLPVQHRALLKRQMKFGALAQLEITSISLGTLTALTSAYYGAGYWSLVMGLMTQTTVDALGVWLACGWRPGWPTGSSDVRDMVVFGSNITGFNTINYLSRNGDNVLIGRFSGAQELGIYSMAYRLLLLPVQQINAPINSVALPVLCKLQHEPSKFANYYYKAMLLVASAGMPLVCFLFADARLLVGVLLGEQWEPAATIFQLLAPAALSGTINVSLGWAFVSLGRADKQLKQGFAASIVTIISFCVGIFWGAIGVAIAYSIVQPFIMIVSLVYCYQDTPLRLDRFLGWIKFPAISAVGAAGLLMAIQYLSDRLFELSIYPIFMVIVHVACYGILYILIWLIIPHGKIYLKEVMGAIKALKRQKTTQQNQTKV